MIKLWNYLKEQQKMLSAAQFHKLCSSDFLKYRRVREWQDLYTQLRQVVKEVGLPNNSIDADYYNLQNALLTGLLSQIGQKDNDEQVFTFLRNTRLAVFPASALLKKTPKWCMAA